MSNSATGSSNKKLTKKMLLEKNDQLSSIMENVIDELENVQQVIDKIDKEANDEKGRVVVAYEKTKKPLFDRRDNIIKNVPNFWIDSFENHPDLRSLVDPETGERLRYLNRLEVQCVKDTPSKFAFKLNFFFNENPYFENDVLCKEIVVKDDDTFYCTSSQIKWKPGKSKKQNKDSSRKRKPGAGSFFDWFESKPRHDNMADSFRELHQEPLRFYRKTDSDDEDDETCCMEDDENDELDF